MEKCIIDLLSSVSQVNPKYFNAIGTRVDLTRYEQIIENTFTAELYHCYRNIMDLSSNNNYYNNLILHFDISKFGGNMRPDLVLHNAQDNRIIQKMFVEVKANPTINLDNDYSKIYRAIVELDFQNVVLVTIDRNINTVENEIQNYFNQNNRVQNIINRVALINILNNGDMTNYEIKNLN